MIDSRSSGDPFFSYQDRTRALLSGPKEHRQGERADIRVSR